MKQLKKIKVRSQHYNHWRHTHEKNNRLIIYYIGWSNAGTWWT